MFCGEKAPYPQPFPPLAADGKSIRRSLRGKGRKTGCSGLKSPPLSTGEDLGGGLSHQLQSRNFQASLNAYALLRVSVVNSIQPLWYFVGDPVGGQALTLRPNVFCRENACVVRL